MSLCINHHLPLVSVRSLQHPVGGSRRENGVLMRWMRICLLIGLKKVSHCFELAKWMYCKPEKEEWEIHPVQIVLEFIALLSEN